MKIFIQSHSVNKICLDASPWISAALLVALFFSAPAVNILESILIITVIISKDLRARFVQNLKSPLIVAALTFYGIIIIGATYSIGPINEAWGMVFGWRKIIILPFVFCAISTAKDKSFLLKTFLATSTLCLIWSYFSYFIPELFYHKDVPGIIIKNHATQGMFFGIAIFVALIFQDGNTTSRQNKVLLYIFTGLTLFNIMTITFGRSGYLVVATLIVIYTLQRVREFSFYKQSIIITLVLAMLLGMFMSSKTSRERIQLGVNEFTQLKTEGDAGSMGVRHYWWQHSLNMIKKNPIFGIGTGSFEKGLENEIKNLTGPAATKTNDPHNQYLKITVEQGILGLVIFLSIIFSAFIAKNVSKPFGLIGLGVLTSWCATSLANSHFSTFHEGHFIWFWLGAMLSPEK
ncbi:O-antigen ligase [Polynucleobacter sp. AM-26B4]|uniref:O-antigen ligase family protein n=1 Tax=Polynucleobacter sp. AM-26B4 TaxID=2689103 RepID=UPI001C0CB45D|nr:O-antigen ligase family protein [Polynucleobacter sp. AM-26B4]MBU3585117.1 O-antigen ligase family protein [Polynucleobacter sp. AM-26B4]